MSDSNSWLNKNQDGIILEACVETIEEAIQAEKNGAHQIEWCGHLEEDGLTPDFSYTQQLLGVIKMPVKVMIRCRPGNFIYTQGELSSMVEDARLFSSLPGIDGLVFGATTPRGTLDIEAIRHIANHANGLPITIHKAIDTCVDIINDVHQLNAIPEVKFILSSGGAPTAKEGLKVLRAMQAHFKGHIIAAGKINTQNISTLHEALAFHYYHGKQIVNR